MAHDPTRLTLNGRPVAVDADPEAPLLYVLRGPLGLKAARFGCGVGLCGACTVIVGGRAVRSCDMPLSAAAGAAVETVEGLAEADPPHPLIGAIVDGQAAQCGYCLPGIVMSAKALLDATPRPSRKEIATALDQNLCRCGAHLRILAAIEIAAARLAGDGR